MRRTAAVSAAHGGSRASLVLVVSVVPSSECPNAGLGLGLKEALGTALVELRSGPKERHPGDLSMHPRQPLVCSFPTFGCLMLCLQGPFHSHSQHVT